LNHEEHEEIEEHEENPLMARVFFFVIVDFFVAVVVSEATQLPPLHNVASAFRRKAVR
jgi:hypothetical protein